MPNIVSLNYSATNVIADFFGCRSYAKSSFVLLLLFSCSITFGYLNVTLESFALNYLFVALVKFVLNFMDLNLYIFDGRFVGLVYRI